METWRERDDWSRRGKYRQWRDGESAKSRRWVRTGSGELDR